MSKIRDMVSTYANDDMKSNILYTSFQRFFCTATAPSTHLEVFQLVSSRDLSPCFY